MTSEHINVESLVPRNGGRADGQSRPQEFIPHLMISTSIIHALHDYKHNVMLREKGESGSTVFIVLSGGLGPPDFCVVKESVSTRTCQNRHINKVFIAVKYNVFNAVKFLLSRLLLES